MKPNRLLVALFAAAGLCAISGCTTNAPDESNTRTIVERVTLDARAKKNLLSIKISAELKVLLPITAGPEYEWQLAANDPRILRQTGDEKNVAGEGGAGTNTVMTFVSLRPGRSAMRFVYVKPEEKETQALNRYDVAVGVKP